MGGYAPLKITGPQGGLVQQREEFLLPDDAYPNLQNVYVWREKLIRKNGLQLLGRLRRDLAAFSEPATDGTATYSQDLLASFRSTEPLAQVVPGTLVFYIDFGGPNQTQYTDNGFGVVTRVSGTYTISSGSINYSTGFLTLNFTVIPPALKTAQANISYYPALPVMGIRIRELQNSTNDQTIFFDQKYAYIFNNSTNAFQEFIPGTTWNAHNGGIDAVDFFWSTNYWVSQTTIPGTATPFFTTSNRKLFWETNNTGQFGAAADPPRITDGVTWYPFYDNATPANTPWAKIDASNYLVNFLSMLPFRGRMVTFNTWEGTTAASAANYSNRIRWSTIGNPFIPFSAGPPATGSWRDDIRGQGGFLDIPTSEDIVSVGFVRDNLVIYCERSTWQLRYTGRSIAPFQIEKVNSELGGEGPFSAVQFDTSLVGIGDKGIVECDSYKSERIDIKIPDLVFDFRNSNNGPTRVHGIRDFIKRLAYWTIPYEDGYDSRAGSANWIFPNRRLLYNYENDSWCMFTDTFTCLGTYQPQSGRTWLNTPIPWIQCKFSWLSSQPAGIPSILGGNQQGFVMYLTRDEVNVNDPSLYISAITATGTTPTVITVPNHNLVTTTGAESINNVPYIIQISGIPDGTPFDNLNGGIFGISVVDQNNLALYKYDPATRQFSQGQIDAIPLTPYIGGGLVTIRENFSIVSKKFNFLDYGQSIQIGYLDILMNATQLDQPGAITLKVYLDYNENEASNTLPQNELLDYSITSNADTFFNSVIPTTPSPLNNRGGSKFWQRVYCPTRANFLTLQYTFSNAQLAGEEQTKDIQIDAQILWIRKAGRLGQL
jgi:hypothetical protein